MERIEIDEIVQLTDSNGIPLLQKFSILALVSLIDRTLLQSIENIYRMKEEGLDIIQFSRFFMNCIEHTENETSFLAAGLHQLFEAIAQERTKIMFHHITDFICDKILETEAPEKELETHWIPIKGYTEKMTYLNNPPIIKGGQIEEVGKVWIGKTFSDKGKHENIVSEACFSHQRKKMFCHQSLADWIGVYTPDTKLQQKIRPISCKVKKDAAVLSIAYSERQDRLGAILKDFSISLWDVGDNYFQKSINTAKFCQQMQTNIWYLQHFQKWATSDMGGTIYIWNLLEEIPEIELKSRHKSRINDICQIPIIGLLAVAQQKITHTETTKIQLFSLLRKEVVAEIDTKIERRILHTLAYSEQYQVLLSAGYEKKIRLYEIDKKYLDSSLRGQLLGHESAITCFTLIKKTPMVVSADDKGKVKIWNIRNFKCMQTIDFTDKVIITRLLDMATQKKIAVMGSRVTLLNLQHAPETIADIFPIKIKQFSNQLYLFTEKDVRIYDLSNGKLKKIDCNYNSSKTQITSILISHKKCIVTGNQKGEITYFCPQSDKPLETLIWHVGAIQYIQQDLINNLLITYSDHSGLIVTKKHKNNWEEIRFLKGNFIGKQLNSFCFSAYHSLIGFICAHSIYVCDYEQFKIQYQFNFQEQIPTCLCVANGLGLIIIGTSKGMIYFFEIQKCMNSQSLSVKCSNQSITHLVVDLKCYQQDNKLLIQSLFVSCSLQSGGIKILDVSEFAKKISLKNSKTVDQYYNPYRQIREVFQNQLKKMKYKVVKISKTLQYFNGVMYDLSGHWGGVNSLHVAQFDQHFLISAGCDGRIKVWLKDQLLGDLNANLPLPYMWDLQLSENRKKAKQILQGMELIQAIFKRFGKDISIGQSQIFKLTSTRRDSSVTKNQENTNRISQRQPTLFQEQFSVIDLNYDKIRRGGLIPVGGQSLKRMEISKRGDGLQRQFELSKQKQQIQRNLLLKSIQIKKIKNDEKETIGSMLRDKINIHNQEFQIQMNPFLKKLQEKLDSSLQKVEVKKELMNHSNFYFKTSKDQSNLKFSGLKKTNHLAKKSLQNYFLQKFNGSKTSYGIRSSNCSTSSFEQSQYNNCNKKDFHFRTILKEMREKLVKSKKLQSLNRLQLTEKTYGNSKVIIQLDQQIRSFRNSHGNSLIK